MTKYRNQRCTLNGIKFDSKKEARRYDELRLMQKAGIIKSLELQPRFDLQDGFLYRSRKISKIAYIADFRYLERMQDGWVEVVEDVKGMKTQVYQLKKKMFLKRYPQFFFKET